MTFAKTLHLTRRLVRATGWIASAVLWLLYLFELQAWLGMLWGTVAAVILFPGSVVYPAIHWFIHDALWPSSAYFVAFCLWFGMIAFDRLVVRLLWRRLYRAEDDDEAEQLTEALAVGRSEDDD